MESEKGEETKKFHIPNDIQEKYLKIAAAEREKFKKMLEDPSLWKLKEEKDGVECFYFKDKYSNSPFTLWLCRTELNCKDNETYYHYETGPLLDNDFEESKKRDKTFLAYRIVELYEKSEERDFYLVYLLVDCGFFVTNRYFIYMNDKKIEENGDIFEVCTPLLEEDEDLIPKEALSGDKKYVRGTQNFGFFVTSKESEPNEKKKIVVNFLFHCDPGGFIPAIVFNASSHTSPLDILKRGRKFFMKE